MKLWLMVLFCSITASISAAQQAKIDGVVDQQLASLVVIYKGIHAAPELSHHEEKTSALLAQELRSLGFEVTEHVGRYANPDWKAYGVVAVLKNGTGPTVLVRADMDALPVEEQTGLPYASHVRAKDDAGNDVAVMHACGHDIHVTSLIGTARVLDGVEEGVARNAGADRPARGREDRRRARAARRRPVHPLPEAGPRAGVARFRGVGNGQGRLHRRLHAGELDDRGRDHPRARRTWRVPARHERSDRDGGRIHHGAYRPS